MNDRIQELYKECTGKDWKYDFDPIIAEKFAELIIDKIVKLLLQEENRLLDCELKEDDAYFAHNLEIAAEKCADMAEYIELYFGVKE